MVGEYLRKINYYETDKMGITHHSNYIRFMEEARIHFLDQIGCGYDKWEKSGIISPVIGIECEYKIVGSNEADPFENKISDRSPIGAALIGKKKGDIIHATTNKNKVVEIKILDVFKA